MAHRPWIARLLALAGLLMGAWTATVHAEPAMRLESSTRQSDGKIVVAGQSPFSSPKSIVVGRLNADGSRDLTFGGGGWVEFGPPDSQEFRVTAIVVLNDGRIVLATVYNGQVTLMRFQPSGALDTSFGTTNSGMASDAQGTGLRINALAPDAAGNLLALGSYTGDATNGVPGAAVARYSDAGVRDTTFGTGPGGIRIVPTGNESELRAAVATPSGGIAAAGYYGPDGGRAFLVAQLLPNGDLDSGFAGSGWTIAFLSYNNDEAFGIGIDAASNIVAVGRDGYAWSYSTANFAAARFSPAGSLVQSLLRPIPLGNGASHATANTVTALADGDLLIGGTVVDPATGKAYFALSRAGTGATLVGPMSPEYDDLLTSAYSNGDGQVVAVGTREQWAYYEFARRARYFADDLEFDTDFAQEGYDVTPNPFVFPPVGGAGLSEERTSAATRISGIDQPTWVSVQGGSYSIGCAEPFTTGDGTVLNGQRICVRTTSAATAATSTSAVLTVGGVQGTFTVTTAGPPDTTINSPPPNPSGQSVVFYYSGDTLSGPITGYECRTDADPFVACPFSPTNSHVGVYLQPGTHTFQVRAINAYGTDPTPASYTWTVVPPPDTTITSGPGVATAQSSATFTFTASDPPSGFMCRLTWGGLNFGFSSCASPQAYTGLSQGTYTFEVYAYNFAGADPTPATYTWTIDNVAPDTRITQWPASPTTSTTGSFVYSSLGETTSLFDCSLDGGAWYACNGGATSVTVTIGTHTMAIRARDAAGNVDATPPSKTWVVQEPDTTPPETTITFGPSGVVATRTASFGYSSSEGGSTFECSLSGGSYNGAFYSCAAGSTAYYNLLDGAYTFQVRATDAAGNVDPTPAVQSFTVDAPPPDTAIDSGPNQFLSDPAFSPYNFAAFTLRSPTDGGASFECSLDGAAFAACGSYASYSSLADGLHVFRARARLGDEIDPTPAEISWTVDTVRPDTIIVAKPASPTSSTTATIAFTSNETGVHFQCQLDWGAWLACTSPVTYQNMSVGSHTLAVKAIDRAGNADDTEAFAPWYIDPATLDTAIASGPSGTSAQASATFGFTSPDADATFECSLDSGAFAACVNPATFSGLAEGSHALQVRARNTAGSVDATPASRSWFIDTVPPDTTITAHPYATTQSSNATFDYAANESASFECRLDGSAWAGCGASRQSFVDLAEGSHTFEVRARDFAGNADASPASFTWTVNFAYGPDTAITSGPSGTVASTSATITFDSPSGTPAVGFKCAFAGTLFDCTSPWTITALSEGEHGFSVYAVDAEGNSDRTPASIWWTVDTSAPDTTITSGPSGTVAQNTAAFTFSATETGVSFQCSLDGAAFASCVSGAGYSGLADGMHMFEVRAVDAAGNIDASPASQTWSVDRTSPNTTITSGPSAVTAQAGATFSFTSNESGTFQCSLDAAPYAACTSPQAFAGLSAASHSFAVYAVDGVGNADPSPATWSWAIDITAPDTSITSGPSGTVAMNTATIAFSSPDTGATFECRLDGGVYAPCASPVNLTGLTDGAHVFEARAKDAAGNVDPTPASSSWTVDTTPPDTSISSGPAPATSSTTATFQFTASGGATAYECKLDAGAFAGCTSPKTYSPLAQGTHTFQVRARDALGNTDASPATWTWTVDTTAPDTTITGGPTGTVSATTATFTFTATESGSTFECQLDSAAYAACTSPTTYTGLTRANHTFRVRARDAAGNLDASPATRNWKVN
jgi:uncharacterized delta-60 repeat protein